MIDPGWAARTPEANDLLLKAGTGVGTTMAAMATYVAELTSCEVTAGLSIANTTALNADFQGASNLASTAKSTVINTVAQLMAGWLTEKPPLITTAVNAYTTASSTMVPVELCQINRDEWATANALNSVFPPFFVPDIVRADTQYYGHYWPNNSGAGAAYSAVLTSLIPALGVPPPVTPAGASAEAPAAAAAAVTQSTATGAAGDAMRASSEAAAQTANRTGMGTESVGNYAQQALQPLQQGLQALPKAFESVVGLPTQLGQPVMSAAQSFTGMFGSAFKGPEAASAATEVARPVSAGGVSVLGPTAGGGSVSSAATGLTSYTRPVSSFAPENGGRPTGLRSAGLLSVTEPRVPTTMSGTGGGAMPLAHGGMLGQKNGENEQDAVTRARIVVKGDRTET